jgi:outer membrane protein TolC
MNLNRVRHFAVRLPAARCAASRRIALAIMLSLVPWLHAAGAKPPATPHRPLSLDAALHVAQQRSHALLAQQHAGDAARERAVAAGRLPDPVLRLSVDDMPLDGPQRFSVGQDFMTMRSVALTQTWTRKDTRRARRARFERESDAARAGGMQVLAALRRDTALAWFDLHYAQRQLELLAAQRTEAELQVAAAQAAYRAGSGTQSDVLLARAAVAGLDERIVAARSGVANARTMLARWIGDDATAPLADPPSIAHTRLEIDELEAHLERHPDVALLAAREAVERAEAEVARQARHADWSVSLMYSRRGAAFSDMVSLGVSIPLQWDRRNRQDRELAAALAQVNEVRAQRVELSREHLARTLGWVESWRSNLLRLHDYDSALIPLARERTLAAFAAYRGGAGTLAGVIDARRMEIVTQVERLRIEMQTAAIWTELEFLIPQIESGPETAHGSSLPASSPAGVVK